VQCAVGAFKGLGCGLGSSGNGGSSIAQLIITNRTRKSIRMLKKGRNGLKLHSALKSRNVSD